MFFGFLGRWQILKKVLSNLSRLKIMKIAIYGAGAIGGHLGAMLSRSSVNVGP